MKGNHSLSLRILFYIYGIAWLLVMPLLKFNKRLQEGYDARCLKEITFGKVDIWIHAASAGEAYLARQILKTLVSTERLKILVTTNTSQGKEILTAPFEKCRHECTVTYLPFDKPSLIRKAISVADPKLLVLIESEIWPGLLAEMKRAGKKILIINGRMTLKSFSGYRKLPGIWPQLKPDTILAISEDDRKRFATVFDHNRTFHVSNLKFDRMEKCRLECREKTSEKFLVLASIRREEENAVLYLITSLLDKIPNLKIGLFPRHMYRLTAWEDLLTENKIGWIRKSRLSAQSVPHNVILWDLFGELVLSYRKADAAFVGGSLAPVGGQNFIEAFMNGVIPVTGPHITNFLWAGQEVFDEGLVKMGNNKEEVVHLLLETLKQPLKNDIIQEKADGYIAAKQGGSMETCRFINDMLVNVQCG